MSATSSALIRAAQHLEEAATILRRAARPDIPAIVPGQIEHFLQACTDSTAPRWTLTAVVYACYDNWCLRENREAMTRNAFGRALTAAGIAVRRGTNGSVLRAIALIPARSEATPV